MASKAQTRWHPSSTTSSSSRVQPVASSRCPARPTKGSPRRSSSAPGASPTTSHCASRLPTPKTPWVLVVCRGQRVQASTSARSDSHVRAPWVDEGARTGAALAGADAAAAGYEATAAGEATVAGEAAVAGATMAGATGEAVAAAAEAEAPARGTHTSIPIACRYSMLRCVAITPGRSQAARRGTLSGCGGRSTAREPTGRRLQISTAASPAHRWR